MTNLPRAALPEALLHRIDVQDALARHDFGQVFFLARKWGGISFSAIAECCDIKPERVGTLARGRGSITSYEKILHISDGMRIPGNFLGLLPRPWETPDPQSPPFRPLDSRDPEGATTPFSVTSASMSADVAQGLMSLTWDDLSGVETKGGVELAGSSELLKSWHAPRHESRTLYLRSGRIGLREVRELEHSAKEFRLWDHRRGGGIRRKAVVGELNELAEFLQFGNPEPVRRRLLGVVALIAMVAAQMSSDVGHAVLAQRYLVLGLQATKESGDLRLGARVSNAMGRHFLETQGSTIALEWIRHAQDTFGARVDAEYGAMLSATEARAHSARSDVESAERCLEHAHDRIARASDTTLFGQAELSGVQGACFETLMMCDRDRAEQHAQRARETTLDALRQRAGIYARSRVLDLIGLANVELLTEGIDQAMSSASLAASSAENLRSRRVAQRLTEFAARALELHPDDERVWGFADLVHVRFSQA